MVWGRSGFALTNASILTLACSSFALLTSGSLEWVASSIRVRPSSNSRVFLRSAGSRDRAGAGRGTGGPRRSSRVRGGPGRSRRRTGSSAARASASPARSKAGDRADFRMRRSMNGSIESESTASIRASRRRPWSREWMLSFHFTTGSSDLVKRPRWSRFVRGQRETRQFDAGDRSGRGVLASPEFPAVSWEPRPTLDHSTAGERP